eukprot:3341496-Pyramimonas_sp.AAC.1
MGPTSSQSLGVTRSRQRSRPRSSPSTNGLGALHPNLHSANHTAATGPLAFCHVGRAFQHLSATACHSH